MKVTEYDNYRHKLAFETKEWQRPVFGEEKTEIESAGRDISKWVQDSLSIGGDDFLDQESSYFVPIPVALVAIVDESLEVKEF